VVELKLHAAANLFWKKVQGMVEHWAPESTSIAMLTPLIFTFTKNLWVGLDS